MREFSTTRLLFWSTRQTYPSSSILAALAIGLVLGLGCTPENAPKEQKPVEQVQVHGQAFTVQPKVWPKLFKCQGSLVADETTTVGSKVAGQISSVPVDLGDVVAKDDVLVQLDSSEYVLQARQAEAQLLQARSAVGLKPDDPLEKLDTDNAPPVREARAIWDEAKKAVIRLRELASRDAVSDTDLDLAESAERVASARFSSAQNGVREKIALMRNHHSSSVRWRY